MSLGAGSSAVLDLKAELLRKRNETDSKQRSATKFSDYAVRKGGFAVEKREPKQRETIVPPKEVLDDETEQALRESRRRLEEKSQYYESLRVSKTWLEDEENGCLVDFNRKRTMEQSLNNVQPATPSASQCRSGQESNEGSSSDDDEWTTFIDTLGRSRKCLKIELKHFLDQDKKLREDLQRVQRDNNDSITAIPLPGEASHNNSRLESASISSGQDACITAAASAASEDPEREQRHRHWAQIEEQNAVKDKIHYSDVLFDEIREHGQAHFEFSRDEAVRSQQMKILDRLREESKTAQNRANEVKRRRQQILNERLRRIREKKGLPTDVEDEKQTVQEAPEEKVALTEKSKSVVESLLGRSVTHVRPWDEGKEVHGVPIRIPQKRVSYVEQRRAERPAEFAPPQFYSVSGLRQSRSSCSPSLSLASKSEKLVDVGIVTHISSTEENQGTEASPRKISKPTLADVDEFLRKLREDTS